MLTLLALIFLPVLAALSFLLPIKAAAQRTIVAISGLLLAVLAMQAWFGNDMTLVLPHGAATIAALLDAALLLYFVRQGIRHRSEPVWGLALAQLLLFAVAELAFSHASAPALVVDALSRLMFLIINVVGSIIVFYAVAYMEHEKSDPARKRRFMIYLLLFLSVMNMIVVADDLLLFFLLFELTTLTSYLLIGFRGDAVAVGNALRALWMNQIGGIAILLGVLFALSSEGMLSLEALIASPSGPALFALSLLAAAAFVKGAAIPFDRWLLGAMVAPTPVSAMLHSATMVKIAPFLILKLSPAIAGTLTGGLVAITGVSVFAAAGFLALSRDAFKEILGYSTIALLGLMSGLAALGGDAAKVAMLLMLFHALSKALLFLAAGVLEKEHGFKSVEQMRGLCSLAPKTTGYIVLGFVSLTLPPFGLLLGKLFAIEAVAHDLAGHPWLIVVLLGIAVGSVLLTLLYFNVASALIMRREGDLSPIARERLSFGFGAPLAVLALLIFAATLGLLAEHPGAALWLPLPILLVTGLPWLLRYMARFERTDEYRCAERGDFDGALFYAPESQVVRRRLYLLFGALFLVLGMSGVIA